MAKLNKQILGRVQGALGDITFRQRNGKSFLSTRPVSFMPGMDAASVERRAKFGLSIKLAKSIYSISELKPLWAVDAAPDVSPFNHLMRTNYTMINATDLSGLIRLAPSLGFNAAHPVIELGPSEVKVNIDAIGTSAGIDEAAEASLKLVSVVYLSDPVDNMVGKSTFLTFVSDARDTDLASAQEFTFTLSDVESQMFAKYQNRKGFFAVLTLDAAGNAVHYSNTFIG